MKFSLVGSSIGNSALPPPSNRTQIAPGGFLLFRSRVLATLIAALAMFQLGQAQAATAYTLPGNLPAGCSATSSVLYTCSNLSLNWADSIKVTNANTKLTITGALDFVGGNDINSSSPASGFVIQANTVSGANNVLVNGDIIAANTLTFSSSGNSITGNISAGGAISWWGSITGSVTTTGGPVTLASGTKVTGNVTSTGGAVSIDPSGVTIGGDVMASGAVSLGSGTKVTGNVTSTSGDVTLASANVGVGMCIKAPSSKTINLGWNASAGGVCCSTGSVCSNTCVANNSGQSMPGLCSVTTLIAQYHMDEAAWAGTTGELKDSAGYTGGPFNGQAIGSPFATPASASPAMAGNPGTCGYATMSGGAFDIPNLPVVTTTGAKTSVAFWMYWDGTDSVMPMGWAIHDLWLVSGVFGFNTGNSDVFGISSSALKNGWHHVVAIFTNGSVSSNKLYIDAVEQSLSQLKSSPNISTAKVSSTLRIGGWTQDNGYRFKSRIDELAVFNGALSASEVAALFAQTHACTAAQTCLTDTFATGTLDTSLWNVYGVGYTPQVVTTPTVATSRLRLTDNASNRATFAQFKRWFPAANNKVVVEFDFYGWGGSGADGISMVLSDASVSPTPGGTGGSLGYANRSGVDGFGGGWLGVGLDEFGNYPGTGEGRRGYPSGYTPPTGANAAASFAANSIAVRGSGSGQSAGYALLANSGTVSPAIKTGTSTTDSTTKHRYRITVDHSNSINAYVSVERDTTGTGSSYSTVIPAFDVKAANSGQAAVPTNLMLSFTGSTGGSTNNHEIGNVRVCATTMNPVGNNAAAANFECMDGYLTQASYNNRQTSPSSRNPLYTKLARTAFKLRVVPLATDGSVKTDYVVSGGNARTVTVELFDDNVVTAPVCSAYSASNLVASQSVTLASGVDFLTADFTVNKAYPKLRCRVTDNSGTPPVYGCSSDQFANRPGAVTLSTTATAAAPSASASPVIKAASSFTLTAATSTKATDVYSGALAQVVTLLTAQVPTQDTTVASGGVVGALTPASLTANATPSGNATYSEVGYLYLAAGAYADASYTAVDQVGDCVSGSTSVTLSGGKYGCVIGTTAQVSLGRFIPDHFSITPGSVSASCVAHPAASGSYSPTDFTYFSQPDGFATPFTLTALNGALTPVPTKNYAGVFARISNPAGISNPVWSWTNTGSPTGLRFGTSSSLPAGAILSAATIAGAAVVPTGNWGNGAVALASVKHQVSRPSALTGETPVTVTALPVDADGVTLPAAVAVSSSSTALRYGRIRLQNAYGSERLALPVPLKLEYYSVAPQGWLPNTDDACTSMAAGNFSFAFPVGTTGKPNNLAACETALTVSGTSPNLLLSLSAPGSSNAGWADLTLNLGSSVLGATSACTAVGGAGGPDMPATMPWLQSQSGTNPAARANFGIYGGPNSSSRGIIYRRENY